MIKEAKEAITKPEINFFLSILIPLIGIAIMWGSITTRIAHLEAQLSTVEVEQREHVIEAEKRFDSIDSVFLEIQVSLAEIKKDIEFIKINVERGGEFN